MTENHIRISKLSFPVVIVSTEDNVKLFEQLNLGFEN